MNLILERVVAVGSLPVRKAGQLIPFATSLYPDEGVGLYSAVQAGTVLFRVHGRGSVAGSGRQHLLQGYLAEVTAPVFESVNFSLTAAAWEVPVALAVTPQGFSHLPEAIQWVLVEAETGKRLATTTTILDLYFAPGMPIGIERGVPYELMLETQQALTTTDAVERQVKVGASYLSRANYQSPPTDVAAITNWIFARNPPRYDTTYGDCRYILCHRPGPLGFNDITLDYTGYLKAKNHPDSTCNCYDIAAIIQYHVQFSAGLEVRFAYMKPSGYLKQTDLIGRKQCNNPFYTNTHYDNHPVCNQMAFERSSFANHAFGYLPAYDVVVDACAGPHVGTENQSTYLTNAQDKDCIFPENNGRVTDIAFYAGVKNVASTIPRPAPFSSLEEDYSKGFAEAVGFASAKLPADDATQVAVLPPFSTCPQLGPAWQVLADDVSPGYPLVRRRVTLGCPEGSLTCDIWVASDGCRSAQRLYLDLGANTSMLTTPFSQGPAVLGDLAGQVLGRTSHRYLWLWHNFVFDMRADRPAATAIVLAVAEWLQSALQASATSLTNATLPRLTDFSLDNPAVAVGEEVAVRASCPPNCTVVVAGDHPGLYLAEEQADLFRFRAVRPSDNTLYLYAVDQQSLLVSQQEFTITVS